MPDFICCWITFERCKASCDCSACVLATNWKKVRRAMRDMRRENGSHCIFRIQTIQSETGLDQSKLEEVLLEMEKFGEVQKVGDFYRKGAM